MTSTGGDAVLRHIADAMGEGGSWIDPPTLMPVDIILELSGEAVRSRLCTFATDAGQEFCLRPDLTTPIASEVAQQRLPPARYHATGAVYRLPSRGSNDPVEHQQAGFEWFGRESAKGYSAQEDADVLALALNAAKTGGVRSATVRFGDVAIYHAVIDALPLQPRWRDRLVRAFSRRKGPRELLAAGAAETSPLVASIGAMSEAAAVSAVEIALTGEARQPVGERGPAEIAARLRDKAAERAPDPASAAAITRYLILSAPAGDSVSMLRSFAKDTGINIDVALDTFSQRLDLIARLAPPFWADARFDADAGRRFEYYDGFVFELARPGAPDRPLVSGGRYDGLVSRLSGGAVKASAIGAALRIDRLAEGSGS